MGAQTRGALVGGAGSQGRGVESIDRRAGVDGEPDGDAVAGGRRLAVEQGEHSERIVDAGKVFQRMLLAMAKFHRCSSPEMRQHVVTEPSRTLNVRSADRDMAEHAGPSNFMHCVFALFITKQRLQTRE
jgi:hypothetical protein